MNHYQLDPMNYQSQEPRGFTFIDIETAPLPVEIQERFMPCFKAAANIKDPVKIAAQIEEKKEDWLETAQLDSMRCYICAYVVYTPGQVEQMLIIDSHEDEPTLLEMLRGEIRSGFTITGWNNFGFDFPMIEQRSWWTGTPFRFKRAMSGYYSGGNDYMDLMQEVKGKANLAGSYKLDNIAKAIGLPGKTEESGKDFYKWDRDRQIAYIKQDALLPFEIAKAIGIISQ